MELKIITESLFKNISTLNSFYVIGESVKKFFASRKVKVLWPLVSLYKGKFRFALADLVFLPETSCPLMNFSLRYSGTYFIHGIFTALLSEHMFSHRFHPDMYYTVM